MENLSLPFLTRDMLAFGQGRTIQLQITYVAHSTTPFEIRGFTKDQPFVYLVVPVGDGSQESATVSLPDVPILLSIAVQSAEVNFSMAHAICYLMVDGNRLGILCQGTITSLFGIAWPTAPQQPREQAEGTFVELFSVNPAAGASASYVLGNNEVLDLTGLSVELNCDATVANRTVTITIDNGNICKIVRTSGTAQTASQDIVYEFVLGGTTGVIASGTHQEVGLPQRIVLGPGGAITVDVANQASGDNLTSISITGRRSYAPIINT